MLKNKMTKLAALSLLGVLGLTACTTDSTEIYAKPSNYNDAIVSIDGSDKIHNNVLSIIYDAIHEGSLSSKVLDKSLYNYAASVFGAYNSLTREKGSTEITLKEAVKTFKPSAGTGTVDKINPFIKAHKAYWTRNDKGEHINDDDPNNIIIIGEKEDFTPCNSERQAVVSKWEAIETRIAENMYNRAVSDTYTTKHLFREIKYLRSLYEDGEKVNYAAAKENPDIKPMFVKYTIEAKDVFKEKILHREYYQSSASEEGDVYSTVKARFIEDEVISQIYSDLLVEQYLLEEKVNAIRNSRARKINVIKIEKYTSYSYNADMLVKALVDEIYGALPEDSVAHVETDADVIEAKGEALFEKYQVIAKGLVDDIAVTPGAQDIVDALNEKASDVYQLKSYTSKAGNEYKYYENTSYADVVKEFKKVDEAATWDDVDESLYSTYTASGTTSIEEGLEQKTLDLKQKQNITKGWYIQSKTPTLDSNGTINERLFKLSVSNGKIEVGNGSNPLLVGLNQAELDLTDRFERDDSKSENKWGLREKWNDENSFVCSINGAYYLKFTGQYVGADRRNDIVLDDGSAYYIVQILEAVSDSKLRNASDAPTSSYDSTRGKSFLNTVTDEIGKVLAETGNYASDSKNHWLEKMDIKYHDQVVYDYFNSNYPDLFD